MIWVLHSKSQRCFSHRNPFSLEVQNFVMILEIGIFFRLGSSDFRCAQQQLAAAAPKNVCLQLRLRC